METEWKKDNLMSTKLCILDKYFRKHSFSFDKTHFVLMGTHYDAAFSLREAHKILSLYSLKIPFISRVVDSSREWLIAPPSLQNKAFPVVTQLYFTGSRVHCSLSPRTFAVVALAPAWRGLSSRLRQLRPPSLPLAGCWLWPSGAPSTGGGWPGIFRGIMRHLMSEDSLPRYPCHPGHRAIAN